VIFCSKNDGKGGLKFFLVNNPALFAKHARFELAIISAPFYQNMPEYPPALLGG